ncbi:hypothetical protein HHUSO_G12724, partial [Huso huso]
WSYFVLYYSYTFPHQRYKVTAEEIRKRIGPPENMSTNSLVAYLRIDKNKKGELKRKIEETVGVSTGPTTSVTSLCSKLTEGKLVNVHCNVNTLQH